MKKHKGGSHPIAAGTLDSSPSHLLHRVLQIALDIYNGETGEGALTQRQYALLKALDGDGEGKSQTDLVSVTGIDRSTLADMVSRMTAKGLIMREKSVTDARANLIRLSQTGRLALDEIEPRVRAADSKILALLSGPKRDSFVKLLRKIAQSRRPEAEEVEPGPAKKAKALKASDKKSKKKKDTKVLKAEKPNKAAKSAKPAPKAAAPEIKLEAPLDAVPETAGLVRLHTLVPTKDA